MRNMGDLINVHIIFVASPEGKRALGGLEHRLLTYLLRGTTALTGTSRR
jgi:hypothetical protein